MRELFYSCFVFLMAVGSAFGQQEAMIRHSLLVGGVERTYRLYVPASSRTEDARALVMVLHGGGGNAEHAARMSGMNATADREGFLVVYPNGSNRYFRERLLTWNSGNCCGYALDANVDDVAFLRAVIDDVRRRYAIDSTRIFVTGISNGGMMAYRLACELSETIAAIAPVAATMNVSACLPRSPVSVIHFHGTDDEHVRFEGGVPKRQVDSHPRTDTPVKSAVAFWVKHNGCQTEPEVRREREVIIERYGGGKNGSEVVLVTIPGGTHSWPGGSRGWLFGDAPATSISATEMMWEFFRTHPRQVQMYK
jgi:polyhydroxybutyrate depolymerase